MTYDPYRRATPNEERCLSTYRSAGDSPIRCEYRTHRYGIHAALTGSIEWIEWCPETGCERVAGHSGCHHGGCYDESGSWHGCLDDRDEG